MKPVLVSFTASVTIIKLVDETSFDFIQSCTQVLQLPHLQIQPVSVLMHDNIVIFLSISESTNRDSGSSSHQLMSNLVCNLFGLIIVVLLYR